MSKLRKKSVTKDGIWRINAERYSNTQFWTFGRGRLDVKAFSKSSRRKQYFFTFPSSIPIPLLYPKNSLKVLKYEVRKYGTYSCLSPVFFRKFPPTLFAYIIFIPYFCIKIFAYAILCCNITTIDCCVTAKVCNEACFVSWHLRISKEQNSRECFVVINSWC